MTIPQKVTHIEVGVYNRCSNLQIVEINENCKLELFDKKAFINCENVIVMIPIKLGFHF